MAKTCFHEVCFFSLGLLLPADGQRLFPRIASSHFSGRQGQNSRTAGRLAMMGRCEVFGLSEWSRKAKEC